MSIGTFDLALRSWRDLSAVVSVIGLPLLFASLIVASTQLRNQWAAHTRRASLDAFLTFSERFQEISALRRTLVSRFQNGDTSLTREDVMVYYNRYWALRQVEWEFFGMGLLPVDVYTAWVENSCRHIANEKGLKFFENGESIQVYSRTIFEEYVLDGMYRRHPACRQFYLGLLDMVRGLEARGVALSSDEAFEAIKKHVDDVARKRRTRRAWRLDVGASA